MIRAVSTAAPVLLFELSTARWAAAAEVLGLLSPEERPSNAVAGRPERYAALVWSRVLTRVVIGGVFGLPPRLVELHRTPLGRPFLAHPAPLELNASQVPARVALVVSRAGRRIGLDLEDASREVDIVRLARRVLHTREQDDLARFTGRARKRRFLRYWTLKEALLKARGTGLTEPPESLLFALDPVPRLLDGGRREHWRFAQLWLDETIVAAVAREGTAPVGLVRVGEGRTRALLEAHQAVHDAQPPSTDSGGFRQLATALAVSARRR